MKVFSNGLNIFFQLTVNFYLSLFNLSSTKDRHDFSEKVKPKSFDEDIWNCLKGNEEKEVGLYNNLQELRKLKNNENKEVIIKTEKIYWDQ
jgi:hypothetical protein